MYDVVTEVPNYWRSAVTPQLAINMIPYHPTEMSLNFYPPTNIHDIYTQFIREPINLDKEINFKIFLT